MSQFGCWQNADGCMDMTLGLFRVRIRAGVRVLLECLIHILFIALQFWNPTLTPEACWKLSCPRHTAGGWEPRHALLYILAPGRHGPVTQCCYLHHWQSYHVWSQLPLSAKSRRPWMTSDQHGLMLRLCVAPTRAAARKHPTSMECSVSRVN